MGAYVTICTNCHEELLAEEEPRVGQMVQCGECKTYMQILGLQSMGQNTHKIGVLARRVPLYEARAMGYP